MRCTIKCKVVFLLLALLQLFSTGIVSAQEDLLSLLPAEPEKKQFVKNAFKATRVITGQSVEQVAAGVLDFRILHRFGAVNGGLEEAFGLDNATMRLGLDYGITDRLMVGIGRSTNKKELDGFVKYRLIWQGTGKGSLPFSMILISGITKVGTPWPDETRKNYYSSRLAFYHQALIGRKFSEVFSLQFMPTVVHRNLVQSVEDEHDIYALGIGTRLKLSRRVAINLEYFYLLPDQLPSSNTNPLSIGFDIETGGHVFQLHLTNSLGLNERSLLTDTNGSWGKGDIHFGFNISRVFTLSKPKSFRKPETGN